MKLGTIVILDSADIDAKFKKLHDMGFCYCQLLAWNHELLTDEVAEAILASLEKYNIKISTFWCGWSGYKVWNFVEGPITLGIVPPDMRYHRVLELMAGSDFAKKLGVTQMATHLGFMPENPTDPNYQPILSAIRAIAKKCKENGQYFIFETGQETPVTLLRVIEDSGCDNLGINLDPANLILYGKANPVDALTVFGKYVKDVHAKDGNYPTDGRSLGKEMKVGEGSVNFPALVAKLKEIGYDATLTIEREISGEQQTKDILDTKAFLEGLI